MPIYEYKCIDCGNKFDALRKITHADSPLECSLCKSVNTERLLSTFFAHGSERNLSSSSHGCGGCSGGSCATCKN